MYRVEDYPQIKDSFLLKARNRGASKKLLGNVAIFTFFMHRKESDWSDARKKEYFAALNEAKRWLENEAQRYGVDLKITSYNSTVPVSQNADSHDGYSLIRKFLAEYTVEQAQEYYEKSFNVDETPFIIAFDEHGRSFAVKEYENSPYNRQEISVVLNCRESFSYKTIAHELLHQFGAVDYYFPNEIKQLAGQYFVNSIMGVGDPEIDDLTAYLIGWKDTISNHSYWFLKKTMWFTEEEYIKAVNNAWKTKF